MESSFGLNTSHTDFELAGVQIIAVILQFLINKKWCPKLHFSSHEPKALSELIGWDSSRRQCIRPSVHTFKYKYLLDQLANQYYISSGSFLGQGVGCIRFWARSDQNYGFYGNR